jgi:hypothetical protein
MSDAKRRYEVKLQREVVQCSRMIVTAGSVEEAEEIARGYADGGLSWSLEWANEPNVNRPKLLDAE